MAHGSQRVARLSIDDKEIDLPVIAGSEGPNVIDVSGLTSQGYFTYDPGFVSTASCDSEDHLPSTATPVCCCTAATPSTSSRSNPTIWSFAICF